MRILFYACLAILLFACQNKKVEERKPYNVLFVSIDDLGPNLGVYNNEYIHSPVLDSFASQSTTFMQAFCQAAVCAPSRASLMTAIRPDSSHVWHLGDKFREINPDAVTMPQWFSKHGYYTVCIGKIFHNYMPDSSSWDEPDLRPAPYLKPEWLKRDGETFYVNEETQRKQKIKRDSVIALRPGYYADGWNNGPAWEWEDVHDSLYFDGAQTELALKTLDRLAQKNQPFYMALGYFRPHLPFAVPKKYWDLYDRNEIPLASNPYLPKASPVMAMNSMYELRGYDGFSHIKHPSEFQMNEDTARILKQGYYASVSYVDAQFGKVLQRLKELGLDKNTIIVVWGDHGWKLGEHNGWCKQTNYNIDIHVPLIVYSPGEQNRGSKTDGITELIDMFPSLCELADIPAPSYAQGSSFVPLLTEPNKKWKTAAFSQFHRRPKVSADGKRYMGYSIRTDQYHYIEWYYWNHETKIKGELAATELYWLPEDPDENENVSNQEKYAEVKIELHEQLTKGWRNARPSN
ncbi:MAG: sulfatase [Bacteroidia bacterium]